jgi:alkanesulfonate monooxygenase SsuD/methylene tetrahydromethanopterin reductase-like flavin-dependent oxidoreductase (luciferase family)
MRPWGEILELAQHCESTGWDGVYFADHFMPNDAQGATPLDGPTLECWSVLAGLAATTTRLRLAPLVTSVTYRHATVLANIAAAVDNMSNGRLLLGLGAGWQENEHAAYGLELGTIKQRLDRFEEAVQVIRSLTRENRTTFKGEYYEVTDAPNQPAPVQSALPILIGRDPSDIQVSTQAMLLMSDDEEWLKDKRAMSALAGTPKEIAEVVAAYKDAGCDELIIPDWTMGSPQRRKDTCDQFIEEVASNFR